MIRKGIGFASFFHGAGFTGSGEEHLASEVAAEATRDGRVRVMAASTEMGQGTNTIFSQIAGEALGIDQEQIEIVQPDTANVPNSGPTVASRTSMIVGKLVETAALEIRAKLVNGGYLPAEYNTAGICRSVPPIFRSNRTVNVIREIRTSSRFVLGRRTLRGARVRCLRLGCVCGGGIG